MADPYAGIASLATSADPYAGVASLVTTPSFALQPQPASSFDGEMVNNVKSGINALGDMISNNVNNGPSPRTQSLADKLFPVGYGADQAFGESPSILGALANNAMRNIANQASGTPQTAASTSDLSAAILEKQGQTGAGKGLSVLNALPIPNAISTGVSRYVNPAIESMTGIAPSNLQLGEELFGLKNAPEALDNIIKTTPDMIQSIGDNAANVAASVVPDVATEGASPAILKAASAAKYQEMRDAGATLNRSGINAVTYNIGKDLSDSGIMNPTRHGDTLSVIDDMNADAAKGSMDLEKLDQYRQELLDVVRDNTSKMDGPNSDAMKANVAINALDNAVDSLDASHLSSGTPAAVDALNQARDLYSAKSRLSALQRIQDNAAMTDNPATSIKNGYRTLAKQVNINPRGWTSEEVSAINRAAKTGIVTGALKIGGNRLLSGVVGGVGGASGGGIKGALLGASAAEALAYPLRAAATALQARRANAVADLVANRPQVQSAIPPSIAEIMKMSPKDAQIALQNLKVNP